jgi:hypothetical protein
MLRTMSASPASDPEREDQDAGTVHVDHAMGTQVGDHGMQDNRRTGVKVGRDAVSVGRDYTVNYVAQAPPEPVRVRELRGQGHRMDFVGREGELARLHELLTGAEGAPVVLHGLGGVGKSQLAVEYFHAHSDELAVVWAARADDASVLAADLAALGVAVGAADGTNADIEAQWLAARAWLAGHPGWLVIIDNADDAAVVPDVHRLLPGPPGRVIVTSRISAWPNRYHRLEVPVLDDGQGAGLLMQHAPDADWEAAESLAKELGGLPLALQQAAGYCQQNGKTLAGYLALFRDARRQARMLGTGGAEGVTVAATWTVSIRQVSHDDPAAAALLDILAYFAPDAIPRSLLAIGGEVALVSQAAEGLEPLAPLQHTDEIALDQALGVLHRYSLAQVSHEEITVHRLVQAVIRASHAQETRAACAAAAAFLIREALPPLGQQAWPAYETLLPHALAVAGHLAGTGNSQQQGIDLLTPSRSNPRDQRLHEDTRSARQLTPGPAEDSPAAASRRDGQAATGRSLPYGLLARLSDIIAARRDGRAGAPQLPTPGQRADPGDCRLGMTPYLETRNRDFSERAEQEKQRALVDLADVYQRRAEVQERITAAEDKARDLHTRLEGMAAEPTEPLRRDPLEARLSVPDTLVRARREREFLARRREIAVLKEEVERQARELREEDSSLARMVATRDELRNDRVRQLLEYSRRRCQTYMRHIVHHHPAGSAVIQYLELRLPTTPTWLEEPH